MLVYQASETGKYDILSSFRICILHLFLGLLCSMQGRDEKFLQNLKERDNLEDLGTVGRIILR
jgi:hypothetical protein